VDAAATGDDDDDVDKTGTNKTTMTMTGTDVADWFMNGLSTNNVIGYGGQLPSALDFAVSTDMTFELSSTTGRQTYTMNNFKIGYRDGGTWWIGYDMMVVLASIVVTDQQKSVHRVLSMMMMVMMMLHSNLKLKVAPS
jgi:hypothetical protein